MSNTSFGYPRELFHPNGFKTMTVYSPDEHKEANAQFDEWRQTHLANTNAAVRGENAPKEAVKVKRARTAGPAEQTEVLGDEG